MSGNYGIKNDVRDDYVDKNGRKSSKYEYEDSGGKKSSFTAPALTRTYGNHGEEYTSAMDPIVQKYQQVKGSFKKGGKVKSTGLYKVHKGERVLTKAKTDALEKKKN